MIFSKFQGIGITAIIGITISNLFGFFISKIRETKIVAIILKIKIVPKGFNSAHPTFKPMIAVNISLNSARMKNIVIFLINKIALLFDYVVQGFYCFPLKRG